MTSNRLASQTCKQIADTQFKCGVHLRMKHCSNLKCSMLRTQSRTHVHQLRAQPRQHINTDQCCDVGGLLLELTLARLCTITPSCRRSRIRVARCRVDRVSICCLRLRLFVYHHTAVNDLVQMRLAEDPLD
jgi:hypothetical protein